MTAILGEIKRLGARDVWAHEAHDFTPWLAENIDQLGAALGIDLEVVQTEASVGSFNVDILARDLGSNAVVVIENQLEATDHSHMGQLITYAAGLDAETVIWVCTEFREEHRQALDWLNRGDPDQKFFGVVVDIIQIDDSRPAVNFKLAVVPNDWSRNARRRTSTSSSEVTERGAKYQAFFQALLDELRTKYNFTNAKVGQPQNWYSFSSGHKGVSYGFSFARGGKLRAEVYLDSGDGDENAALMQALESNKAAFEEAIGKPLEWEHLDGRRACRIATYESGSIDDPEDLLERHRQWAVENLLKLKSTFDLRLRAATT